MSGVDVLAVMDRAAESAGLMVKASGDLRAVAYQDDLFKARAAVAELIEADFAYDVAMATRHSLAYLACAPIKQRRIQERLLSACKRRTAALSRVRGAE